MKSSYKGLLAAIECFDKHKNSILKAGYYNANDTCSFYSIELDDDERVVGFQSGSRGDTRLAHHYDMQLVIGKMVWLFRFY